jgi:hypothetical protein
MTWDEDLQRLLEELEEGTARAMQEVLDVDVDELVREVNAAAPMPSGPVGRITAWQRLDS